MKNVKVLLAAVMSIYLFSCNSTTEEKNVNADSLKTDSIAPKTEEVVKLECPAENKLEVGAKKLATTPFEIKDSWATKISDSEVELIFTNVPRAEIDLNTSKLKGKQVKVKINIKKRDNTAVNPGTYVYHYDNESETNYMISEVCTKEGITYLFWGAGDPNPATLVINDITNEYICGTINAETKDSETLGKQVIKGDFNIKF